MAGNEICCTVKLDEDDWKAIKGAIMSIEKRLERIEAILDARGLDWDHPKVEDDHFADASKMVAEEPPKKWRILEPGEVVQEGDWVNAIDNKLDEDPPGGGWIPARASVIGLEASQAMGLYVARPGFDDPAKEPEPEHPAGPKPEPGDGYRILSKNPLEDLTPGDEFEDWNGQWIRSSNAETNKKQGANCWYRRKIEQPKPAWEPKVGDWVRVTRPQNWKECADPCWSPHMHQLDGKVGKIESECEGRFHICGFAWPNGLRFVFDRDWLSPAKPPKDEYREPVLPADAGKKCEFSDDGQRWLSGWVYGWVPGRNWVTLHNNSRKHARIKKDA